MSGNPRLQPNGWWEQDRVGPASKYHKAGHEVAAFCGKVYDPATRSFWERPAAPVQHPKGPHRDPKTGRFAKKRRNKVHNHPPKRRGNA